MHEVKVFSRLTFEGKDGRTRTFYGCSLVGVFEFEEDIETLHSILRDAPPENTIGALYKADKVFKTLCDNCLKLNGIDPDWVNMDMLVQLLFAPGLLIQLNSPEKTDKPKPQKETSASPRADFIACLASQSGSMAEAFEVANSQPAKQVIAAMNAYTDLRNEQAKTKEDRDRDRLLKEMRERKKKRLKAERLKLQIKEAS